LKVQNRHDPTPTSMKSTTPRADRRRSSRLPIAPPITRASATTVAVAVGRVRRYIDARSATAKTAVTLKMIREYGPAPKLSAAPGL
jgi:hypothetical protein